MATLTPGPAQAADLSISDRTGTVGPAQQPAIDNYVKGQIARLMEGKNIGPAREELGRQPEVTQAVTPSVSFQQAYVKSVIANITPLLTNSDVSKRLNAAIVISRLANATKQIDLAPVVQKLMADESPAVAIWGVKGASALLPPILNYKMNRDKQQLVPAIVASAKKHVEAGPLVQDAYNALYLPDQQPPLPPEAFQLAIDGINEILAARIQKYTTGVPAAPQAESLATVFFARDPVRQAMASKPVQQLAVMQHMLDLLSLAGQQLGSASGENRAQLISLISKYAGALRVTFDIQKQSALVNQYAAISKVRDPVAPTLQKQIEDAALAVRALPAYKALKDSPKVSTGG